MHLHLPFLYVTDFYWLVAILTYRRELGVWYIQYSMRPTVKLSGDRCVAVLHPTLWSSLLFVLIHSQSLFQKCCVCNCVSLFFFTYTITRAIFKSSEAPSVPWNEIPIWLKSLKFFPLLTIMIFILHWLFYIFYIYFICYEILLWTQYQNV